MSISTVATCAIVPCVLAVAFAAQASEPVEGVRLVKLPSHDGCVERPSLRVLTDDLERVAQGDAMWAIHLHARELLVRCPQTRQLGFEVLLNGTTMLSGEVRGAGSDFRMGWQNPEIRSLMAQRQAQGRWRPAIEQRREAAQAEQARERELQAQQRAADESPKVAGPVPASVSDGIRVSQATERVCDNPARLRVEIGSLDYVATGDDQFALMEVARELWKGCPSISWVHYEVMFDGKAVRTGEGRRNTRLTAITWMSFEAQQAYERGRRDGRWRPALAEERREGLAIPEDIPDSPEKWAAVYRNTIAARARSAEEAIERENVAAAMRPDGSGLAPFRRPFCHGLAQSGRSALRPTDRDVCEALYDHLQQHPIAFLTRPTAVACTASFDWQASFPGGLLCDFDIDVDVFAGLNGPMGFKFEQRRARNLRTPGQWRDIPRHPAVFAFDAEAKRWVVHSAYASVLAERTKPREGTPEDAFEDWARSQEGWREREKQERAEACRSRNLGSMRYWTCG